jgi:two-component system, sensor histidine kinase and response regulator
MDTYQGYILIVDDVIENVEVLIRILNREGYEISIAQDGQSALDQVATARPDLILLDVMMPGGMDGFEVCERLKGNPATRDIPVIFVTALANTVYIIRGFEVGAVDFITKPFRAKEVMARVNTHLTIQRQKQEIHRLREQDRIYFQKLTEIKDDVMRMTSHDLKNPLNNVKTAVHLLRRHGQLDDDTGREYLDILEASAAQMQNLISGVLDLAKIETGQALNLRQTPLIPFLEENLRVFQLSAQDKDIVLIYEPPAREIDIYIDTERMAQVLQNLISNAIKYTSGGGKVTLRARIDDDIVRIDVADTGIGIPEDAIPHLFEKFYRVQNGEHLQIEGTGLGLSIVQSIVTQHHGEIKVESALGEGTTFSVCLPV